MSRVKIVYEDALKRGGKRGTVKSFSYPAWSISHEKGTVIYKRAKAYLPYGYDESKEYPVLFLLHGERGDENTLLPIEPAEGGSMIPYIADYLIKKGAAKECIIFCANGRTHPDFAVRNGGFPQKIEGSTLGFFEFDREIRRDILPYLDAHFPVSKKREARAIAGVSLGGVQAVNLGAMRCGDLFAYAGAFSPASCVAAGPFIGRAVREQRTRLSLFFLSRALSDEKKSAYDGALAGLQSAAAGGILRTETREYEDCADEFQLLNRSFFEFFQLLFQTEEEA